jgi:hypothetical protein
VEVRDISRRSYLEQAELVREIAGPYNGAGVLVDATAHDQMVEQLRRDGVDAGPFRFTNECKGELIDGLVLALEQGRLRIPPHEGLLRELAGSAERSRSLR